MAVVFLMLCLQASAEDSAKGTLTVNGTSTELKHAYVDDGSDDLIVVLTDRPLSKDDVPFRLQNLAAEDKVRGIVFTVSKGSKSLTPGLNVIYHPVWEEQLGIIGDGVLTLSRLDGKEVAGSISTPKQNTFSQYTFSYDVSFDVKIPEPEKVEPPVVEILGADDPTSKAYAEYYRAMMAGDKNEVRKHLASEIVKQADEETIVIVIDLAQSFQPTNVKMIESEIKGDEAVLKAEGFRGEEKSTASITMRLGDGEWKVVKDAWNTKMK
jgi:hypothetical protein